MDWSDQRIDATGDEELRAILRHNRDEEKEHAAMVLEWLRRHDPSLSDQLREYLFIEGPIMQKEKRLTPQRRATCNPPATAHWVSAVCAKRAPMNQLLRQIAPITETAWSLIDEEAKRTLKIMLSARKLIDFSGPHGWDKAAVPTGRTQRLNSQPEAGVEARLRTTLPLVELRTPFSLSRDELEAIGRGAKIRTSTRCETRRDPPQSPKIALCSTDSRKPAYMASSNALTDQR